MKIVVSIVVVVSCLFAARVSADTPKLVPAIEVQRSTPKGGGRIHISAENVRASRWVGEAWSESTGTTEISNGYLRYRVAQSTEGWMVHGHYTIYWDEAKKPIIVNRDVPVAENRETAKKILVDRDMFATAWKSKTNLRDK